MNTPTIEQIERFIESIKTANRNYTQIAIHYVGRNDAIYDNCCHDVKQLGALAGYLLYLKESMEREHELLD